MRGEAGLSLSKADRKALYLWAVGEVQVPSRPLACVTLTFHLWNVLLSDKAVVRNARQTVCEELTLCDYQLYGPQFRSHLVSKREEEERQ